MKGIEALVEVITGALIFAGAWISAKYTQRGAQGAANATAAVQDRAVEVDREDRFIGRQQAELERLTSRLAQVERDATACSDQNARMMRAMGELERKVDRLNVHVESARKTIESLESSADHLRIYARTLRNYIEQRGHPVPDPPVGLVLDDDDD